MSNLMMVFTIPSKAETMETLVAEKNEGGCDDDDADEGSEALGSALHPDESQHSTRS